MVEFFRDVLDGPLYIIVVVFSIIFIMAIIGFLMEKKKLEKQQQDKIAVIDTPEVIPEVTPVQSVTVEEIVTTEVPVNEVEVDNSSSNSLNTDDIYQKVETPVIVFEDPDQKEE